MPTRSALALVGVILLAGCSTQTPQEPAEPAPLPPGDVAADDCVVGTWNLDVAAYSTESEGFIRGLGVPLDDFQMEGAGKLTFTDDGLVAADVDLYTTVSVYGNVVASPSTYTTSGDWSRTDESELQFDNWGEVTLTSDIPPEVDLPSLDLTQLDAVTAECSANELVLQGPEAPLRSVWSR
ncbi:MAG: hypothetical protein ACKVOG_02795 [Rhodoglobus sp.]